MKALLSLLLVVLVAGCVDPGSADEADDPPGDAGASVDAEPTVLLEEGFQAASTEPATFTVSVPEGVTGMEVRVHMDESVYQDQVWLEGLGDCDDLEMGASSGVVVNLGSGNGSGGSSCEAPAAGDHDITLGIETGVVTGILTVTAV